MPFYAARPTLAILIIPIMDLAQMDDGISMIAGDGALFACSGAMMTTWWWYFAAHKPRGTGWLIAHVDLSKYEWAISGALCTGGFIISSLKKAYRGNSTSAAINP